MDYSLLDVIDKKDHNIKRLIYMYVFYLFYYKCWSTFDAKYDAIS